MSVVFENIHTESDRKKFNKYRPREETNRCQNHDLPSRTGEDF